MKEINSDPDVPTAYIRDNFEPSDRLAVVVLNKRSGSVIQRVAPAEKISKPDFQSWLRYQNARQWEIYISMNALSATARGRTKQDIATIRHVYLDFDENGTEAVNRLFQRPDLPKPNYLVNSSPDKWQVIWRVEGFAKADAESLQRTLARELLADPAATDCARVLRLPGFYNHKYADPHLIRAELLTAQIYHPEQFPKPAREEPGHRWASDGVTRTGRLARGHSSQSERDWAYAKRALARGESPDLVAAAIACYRRHEKHDPQYYADLTVKKAAEALRREKVEVAIEKPERF